MDFGRSTSLSSAVEHSSADASRSPRGNSERLLHRFNETAAKYPKSRFVHELVSEQVTRTPHAVAVLHEGRQLTYAQLDAEANQLAQQLLQAGIRPDLPVAVCIERSLAMVIGVLAILKAGAAYMPLDPSYPPERLAFMLADANPQMVLTQGQSSELLRNLRTAAPLLDLDRLEMRTQASGTDDIRLPAVTARNLVYVIYTSGSTGRPKGTAMPHSAMCNLLEWHRRSLPLSVGERVLQFAALSFDVAFQEIFSTLSAGGTLVLVQEWLRKDAPALLNFLVSNDVQRIFTPPLMLQSLAEHAVNTGSFPHALRDVITAGEQLRIGKEIRQLFQALPRCRLHNHYGPTETHVVTALTLEGSTEQWPLSPSIGGPIGNARIHVLDTQGSAVPVGEIGEIFIAGAALARTYLNRPELTAERFIADPFSGEPGARLYKTGDLARWCADGSIEYLGRNDDQVKIRGFRVELGEIERRIVALEQIMAAVVIVREDSLGDKRLVAYVTTHDRRAANVDAVRSHIRAALPEHMIPSAIVTLLSLPVTPNGKLDRKALPAPRAADYALRPYEAPLGEVEQGLAKIWKELLRVERVGRRDSFLELGGHSLLATQAAVRIQAALSVEVPVSWLFEHATIAQLAVHIEELREAQIAELLAGGGEDIQELFERVSSISDSKVAELLSGLRVGGRS